MPGHPATGFSLIEQLVAVVVLSIGVLGLSGLQLKALQQSQASLQKSQAAALASAVADMMRANAAAAHDGSYHLDPQSPPDPAQSGPDCGATPCTADDLANYDLRSWYGQVLATLPGATAKIECGDTPCKAQSVQTVWVYWQELRNGARGLGCGTAGYDPDRDLSCVVLGFQP